MDPARYAWKVRVNTTDKPEKGHIHLDGNSMSNTTEIRINVIDWREKLNLYNFNAGNIIYSSSSNEDTSPFTIHGWILSGATDNKWKYKGYANIKFIQPFEEGDAQYLRLLTNNLKWAYGTISESYYHFTIPGLF